MEPKDAARSIAIGRMVFGAGMLALPRFSATAWVGSDGGKAGARLLMRGLAARDLGLGAALFAALQAGAPLKALLAAGVLCDATDLAATIRERSDLPGPAVPVVALAAGGGIALGLLALTGGDEPAPIPA